MTPSRTEQRERSARLRATPETLEERRARQAARYGARGAPEPMPCDGGCRRTRAVPRGSSIKRWLCDACAAKEIAGDEAMRVLSTTGSVEAAVAAGRRVFTKPRRLR